MSILSRKLRNAEVPEMDADYVSSNGYSLLGENDRRGKLTATGNYYIGAADNNDLSNIARVGGIYVTREGNGIDVSKLNPMARRRLARQERRADLNAMAYQETLRNLRLNTGAYSPVLATTPSVQLNIAATPLQTFVGEKSGRDLSIFSPQFRTLMDNYYSNNIVANQPTTTTTTETPEAVTTPAVTNRTSTASSKTRTTGNAGIGTPPSTWYSKLAVKGGYDSVKDAYSFNFGNGRMSLYGNGRYVRSLGNGLSRKGNYTIDDKGNVTYDTKGRTYFIDPKYKEYKFKLAGGGLGIYSVADLLNNKIGGLRFDDKTGEVYSTGGARYKLNFITPQKTGGTLNLYQQGGKMNDEQIQQAFLQFLAQKSGAKNQKELEDYVKQLGEDGLKQAYAEFTEVMQKQTQKAKQGAKLNYIKQLKHQCPEGYDLYYYKTGGLVNCGCKKKGGEIKKDEKKPMSAVEKFKTMKALKGYKSPSEEEIAKRLKLRKTGTTNGKNYYDYPEKNGSFTMEQINKFEFEKAKKKAEESYFKGDVDHGDNPEDPKKKNTKIKVSACGSKMKKK